ncbi:hypothetical protein EJD97_024253 [Solanum chilense]|uniref:CCHC-type domain-containing protein n=1 Tax=Solanum chilense TaxID=4083 RepID=A0A6N2C1T4_SOLCI|nr:hypothetical protein EJD97_024253 [Solanum chilense]
MNTKKMAARRMEIERVNEEVPPEVDKLNKFLRWAKSSRDALIAIARAVTLQANLNMMPRVVERTMTSRLKSRSAKFKVEKGGCSIDGKPIWAYCRNKHYGECQLGTGSSFGCGKDGHKVRDCPMIASRDREAKQVAPIILKDDSPTKNIYMHSVLG